MAAGGMKKLLSWALGALLFAAIVIAALWYAGQRWAKAADPVTISQASLQAVQAQNKLTPFAARFVAVVTAEQSRFGLRARKTLIMPGLVRYSLDLASLQARDLAWDAATQTLSINLPPLEIEGPEVDLAAVRQYGEGGVLLTLTDAEAELDRANQAAARRELLTQARGETTMKLAREAAKAAIERSFAMPLAAAGIEAKITAQFADEGRTG
jgi:ABC-type amino acid transport substrate-binding protein